MRSECLVCGSKTWWKTSDGVCPTCTYIGTHDRLERPDEERRQQSGEWVARWSGIVLTIILAMVTYSVLYTIYRVVTGT